MEEIISKKNPFGITSKGFAYEIISKKIQSDDAVLVLDFGCRDGDFLLSFDKTDLKMNGVGVDVDTLSINKAVLRSPVNFKFFTIQKNQQLPFPNHHFDIITIIGVVEHVYNQEKLLLELKRLLKLEGLLVIAVPGQHFFSFLDMGNFKFRFPKLHKWYYCYKYSTEQYIENYANPKSGMIGDIEAEKAWHEHFTAKSMENLLSKVGGMKVINMDGWGFFYRIINNTKYFMPNFIKPFFDKMIYLDSLLFSKAELCFVVKLETT